MLSFIGIERPDDLSCAISCAQRNPVRRVQSRQCKRDCVLKPFFELRTFATTRKQKDPKPELTQNDRVDTQVVFVAPQP